MEAVQFKSVILFLVVAVWRRAIAAGNSISNRIAAVNYTNVAENSCFHRWGRDERSKLIGCGAQGCAWDVHDEMGRRGVKKVHYDNSSIVTPKTRGLTRGKIIFLSSLEILELLDGECSFAQPLDFCFGHGGWIPYIVYKWQGTTTIKSYYIDAKRPIPGHALLSWFDHAMKVVSPCAANHGVVVDLGTDPLVLKHLLIDPSGVLIPATEFVLIDPDS